MKNTRQLLACLSLAVLTAIAYSAERSAPADSHASSQVASQKASYAGATMDANRRANDELELELLKKSIDYQDKRLNDIWGLLSALGYIAALLGVLTTSIVVFFSVKSTSSAVATAKDEANRTVEAWMRTHGESFLQVETEKVIAPKLVQAIKEIKDETTTTLLAINSELQKTVKLNESLDAKANGQANIEIEESVSPEAPHAVLSETGQSEPEHNQVQGTAVTPPQSPDGSARASYREAVALRAERPGEAIAKLESILEEIDGATSDRDCMLYLDASTELGKIYERMDQYEKAVAIFERAIDRNVQSKSSRVIGTLGRAFQQLGLIHERNGFFDEAIEATNRYLAIYAVDLPIGIAGTYAIRCLNTKTRCLFTLGNWLGVITTYNDAQTQFPDLFKIRSMQITLGSLRTRTARALIKLERTVEAKKLLRDAIEEIKTNTEPGYPYSADSEKLLLGSIFEDEKNIPEALAIYQEISNTQDRVRTGANVLQALLRKAAILSQLHLVTEEMNTYEDIVTRWKAGGGFIALAAYAAAAMVNKAILLSQTGRTSEALTVVNEVITHFQTGTEPDLVEQTAKAARLRALLLR